LGVSDYGRTIRDGIARGKEPESVKTWIFCRKHIGECFGLLASIREAWEFRDSCGNGNECFFSYHYVFCVLR